jgi:hypothetical protein
MKLAIRSSKMKAIAGASLVSILGITSTGYYVSRMTETIVTAGSVIPDGALESTSIMFDGLPYVISVIPAGLRMKVIVGGLLVVGVGFLAYKTYKYVNKHYAVKDKQAVDFNKPLFQKVDDALEDINEKLKTSPLPQDFLQWQQDTIAKHARDEALSGAPNPS